MVERTSFIGGAPRSLGGVQPLYTYCITVASTPGNYLGPPVTSPDPTVEPAGDPPEPADGEQLEVESPIESEPLVEEPSPDEDAAHAPPVVVTVVAHDPGDWFEETLRSLDAQDYP